MERGKTIITVLIVVLVVILAFALFMYNKNNQLKSENKALNSENQQLTSERDQLSNEKTAIVNEREQCRNETYILNSRLSMLEEDVFQLKKSCMSNNACQGHFPSIRWKCNIQGDAVNDGDKTCICDENCNLQVN